MRVGTIVQAPRRVTVLVFAAALLMPSLAVACGERAVEVRRIRAGSDAGRLDFRVSLPAGTFGRGELIPLTMRLQNASPRPVIVNKRFEVNDRKAAHAFREVFLRISGPDGRSVRFRLDIMIGFPGAEEFVELPPGGSVESTSDLTSRFALDQPGAYKLTAVYEQDGRGPAVRARMRSNSLAFTLT